MLIHFTLSNEQCNRFDIRTEVMGKKEKKTQKRHNGFFAQELERKMVRGYSDPERKLCTMYKNGKRQRRTRGIVDKKWQ